MDDLTAYSLAVDSVALIYVKSGWESASGTGVLLDAERGYIITACHVVGEENEAAIFFPARDRFGDVVSDPDYYFRGNNPYSILADVIDRNPEKDLALLRLKRPSGGRPMAIAHLSAKPASRLYSIGNGGTEGPLWRFSSGSVRQVYRRQMNYRCGQMVNARIIEMTMPTSCGDSGGPIFNSNCELVGIHVAGDSSDSYTKAIDVTEIWKFLRRHDMSVSLYDSSRSGSSMSYRIAVAHAGKHTFTPTHRYTVSFGAGNRPVVSSSSSLAWSWKKLFWRTWE